MSDSRTLQPGQSISQGRFTLVRALGRGGMGVVWLGQDTRLGEEVALKFLPPEVAADAVALNDLRRETARSHKLTHPNIIRIHDFHEQADAAFISMEFVDGPTLSAWRLQQTNQVLTWEALAPLVQQLCAALDYAHGESVIHRDLKPANVMLDAKGRLKLADFGIAAVVSDSVSRVSMLGTSGTLAYMSPQQLTGERPAATDDIYALGATLYELLTGKPPFCTGDITHQVLHKAPEPVEDRLANLGVANTIPPDVGALIMACLAKDPTQRPRSAAAVAGWIGLATEKRHSVADVASAVFPGAVTEEESPPGSAGQAPISVSKRVWLPVAAVSVLLIAGIGAWQFAKHRARNVELANGAPRSISPSPAPKSNLPEPPSSVGTKKGYTPPVALGPFVPQTPARDTASQAGFVSLFNGRDLTGWHLRDPKVRNSWSVTNGILTASVPKGSPGNDLVSNKKFWNFTVKYEYPVPDGGNSGLYLRGRHELQITGDYASRNATSLQGNGAIYRVKAPDQFVSRPDDQWQSVEATIIGNKITVVQNGVKTHDNVECNRVTGGELDGNVGQPGPILLQSYPGTVSFRNLQIKELR